MNQPHKSVEVVSALGVGYSERFMVGDSSTQPPATKVRCTYPDGSEESYLAGAEVLTGTLVRYPTERSELGRVRIKRTFVSVDPESGVTTPVPPGDSLAKGCRWSAIALSESGLEFDLWDIRTGQCFASVRLMGSANGPRPVSPRPRGGWGRLMAFVLAVILRGRQPRMSTITVKSI